MLAKQPEHRPAMREIVENLHAFEFSTPGVSVAGMAEPRRVSWRRRTGTTAAGTVLLATLLMLGVRSFLVKTSSSPPVAAQPIFTAAAVDAGAEYLTAWPSALKQVDLGPSAPAAVPATARPRLPISRGRAEKPTPAVRAPLNEDEIVQLK
jgi:hypothetical protein